MLVYVEYYNQISFKDVIMRNAPFWTLHPAGCDDVLIWGLPILNDLNVANSDCIDPEHSTNVRFSNITCDSENGVFLSGSRGNHIEAILFENVRVVQSQEQMAQRNVRFGSGIRTEDRGDQDFRILYAQSRPCVILRNCQVKFKGTEKHDFSHALYVEECWDMTLENFRGQAYHSSLDNVVIRQDES